MTFQSEPGIGPTHTGKKLPLIIFFALTKIEMREGVYEREGMRDRKVERESENMRRKRE